MSITTIAGVTGKSAEAVKNIANGDATAKDYANREVTKFKNFLKTSAKWGATSAVFGGAGAALGAHMDGVDLISKLPKFAQNGINNLLNKDSVKKFANATSTGIELIYGTLVENAKAHPIAATVAAGLSVVSSLVGLKIVYDHGKANGKADQKFDDTVQVNKQLRTQNPLNA